MPGPIGWYMISAMNGACFLDEKSLVNKMFFFKKMKVGEWGYYMNLDKTIASFKRSLVLSNWNCLSSARDWHDMALFATPTSNGLDKGW